MALAAGMVGSVAAQAAAQTAYEWNAGSGTWDSVSNTWTALGLPISWTDGTLSQALFGGFLSSGRTITLSSDRTASGISFSGQGAFNTVTGGTINLANALGDDFVGVSSGVAGGTLSTSVGGHTIASGITFSSNLAINNDGSFGTTNLSLTGPINRATSGGSISYAGKGNAVISGSIGNSISGGLSKSGSGTLHLSGTNAFSGGVSVSGGVLSFASDAALGDAANSVTLSGGTLRSTATTTLGASRVLNVASASQVDVAGGTTLTLAGPGQLAGSGPLTIASTGLSTSATTLAISGANPGFTGSIAVGTPGSQLVGSTLAARNFALANATTGTTLALSGTASLPNATGITVNNGSALTITQTDPVTTGRFANLPITLNTGRFQYNSNGTVAFSDTLGDLSISGTSVIINTATDLIGGGTTVNFGNLSREDHAVLALKNSTASRANIGNGEFVTFANLTPDSVTSGVTRSVVPWAVQIASATTTRNGSILTVPFTYDATGFRPLNTTTEMTSITSANTFAAAASGINARVGGTNQTISTSGQYINCMLAVGTLTVFGDATASTTGGILTNTSGAWSGALNFSNATLFNPNGAYFNLTSTLNVSNFARFTGAGGVAVSGLDPSATGQLNFTNAPAEGNSFTGGLFINGNAGVTFTQNNQLGNDGLALAAGDITLGGGQLILASPSTVGLNDGAANRAIRVNASNGTIGTNIAGAVLQVPGVISGPGQLQFGGSVGAASTGVVELTNPAANTYTGGTLVSSGILRISSANQLGTGSVLLNGGTLQAGANLAFGSAPILTANSTIDTQANNISFNNGMSTSAGITGTAALTTSLTKVGAGTLTFAGTTTLGPLNVNAGTVLFNGSYFGAASGTPMTVNSGATIGGSGSITLSTTGASNLVSVLAGGTVAPGASAGTLTINGDILFASGASLASELTGSVPGSLYDVLAVNGAVDVTGATFSPTLSYVPGTSDKFFVVVNDGSDAIAGTFAGLADGSIVTLGTVGSISYSAQISYFGDSNTGAVAGGNDIVLYNVVPAPGAVSMLTVAGLIAGRRRRLSGTRS